MLIAGFHKDDTGDRWKREMEHGVFIAAEFKEVELDFSLYPSIGSHGLEEHRINAASASVMFKVLMTLAERCNGQVFQNSLVGECQVMAGSSSKRIAFYPGEPLRFENLCFQFQEVLLSGNPQITEGL